MLRWLRRRWRRMLLLSCVVAGVVTLLSGAAGDGDNKNEAVENQVPGAKQPAMAFDRPPAANMVFRKSLQAFPDKDSPRPPNAPESARKNPKPTGPEHRGNPRQLPAANHPSQPDNVQQRQRESNFKIYVYELPARFNANLTACAQATSDGCYKFDGSGMGPELRRHDHLSYRDTHQLSLEIILHEKMLRSRFRTLDAGKADAFYVPFYPALACACKSNSDLDVKELFADLWRHLATDLPYFGSGGSPLRPHFLALGKVEREFWTGNCPFLRDAEQTSGITFIGVEKELNEELRKYFKRTNVQMVVAPYPSYGHFDSSYTRSLGFQRRSAFPSDIRQSMRDVRVFMAVGSRKGHDVRVILKRRMTGTSQRYSTFTASSSKQRRYAVWYSTPECRRDMQLPIVDWMRHAVFCLQPPGDSLTRKSFYDAVMAGCIPVTFKPKKRSASVAYPFQDRLDYTRFTVNIPLDDVLSGAVQVLDRLRIIPDSRIANMQLQLAEAAARLQYSYPPTSEDGDAFSMVVEEMEKIAA